ncbi:uncharacterized protein N0V89_001829 [Didymosphaeria variabile]|uniref:Myb-like domain-containing protein n=1 Tax=Didymosphaeria variabile TaxID=1932322 RepID=A0A9W8XRN3_9PLEO|nr:uncharacterized protein N0V89_001829 [Didymosphaeria variabile]KAJ4357254.1 hypothetical protein N0V89_001829 [Didymosphaeria variabile]
MEPRIATLLGDSPLERPATDALSRPPPPPPAPRKPHPVEPTTANDHVRANAPSTASSRLGQSQSQSRHQHSPSQEAVPKRQKPSAPIASVLNTVTPFSGRLSDLLLDPSQQQAPKRKRVEEPNDPLPPTGSENSLLTLPKPHQQPKKSTKRPRIPPLLQGLHQVPPQAQSRLFPPITSESGAFSRDLGDGAALRTTTGAEKRKELGDDTARNAASGDGAAGAQEDAQIEAQGKPASASTSDKENRTATDRSPTSTTPTATKELRKRNKWSEQETKDLLVGVSRFGIGSWKKILQCPDFTFNQRTAVDLKDRFRTCCPGEGLKARKSKRKGDAHDDSSQNTTVSSTTTSMSSNQDPVAQETLDTISSFRKNRGDTHRKGPAELREMGIHGSFTRSNRRERRPFTEQDDASLLRGFEKYASSWHLIRDDKDLGFSTRQPTDLRDRFRIRYPEMFAKAGYKLKPKDEAMLKEKEKGKNKEAADSQTSANSNNSPSSLSRVKASAPDTSFSSLTSTSTSNSNLMPLALRESFLTSFAGPLDDFGDLDSEADGDHSRSPIILNRNIFEWADANPSQMAAVTTTNLPSMGHLASDAPLSISNVTDATHINPMITLNLPMALLNSNVLSSATSQPSSSHAGPSSRLSDLYHHPNPPAPAPTPATTGLSTVTTKHTTDPIFRTPNLPTIVFPHVPASSARSAMHNLPPPADLLSGLDPDARPEAQTAPFMFDDALGFANAGAFYSPGATLAPMNSMPGREMLTLERGLLQEPGRGG